MYRISKLNQLDRKLYHTNDLALLWNITNRSNLYITISRYMKKGILFPVYKGLYAAVPPADLNPLDLARSLIHGYTYLTTESVLAQNGIISQRVFDFTLAAAQSKRIIIGDWSFRFRQLKPKFLHHPAGILVKDGVFIATTERAVADMLYFNPKSHFDIPEMIDFDKVQRIRKEIGYPC